MYKDLITWAVVVKGINDQKVSEIKKYQREKQCGEIKALMDVLSIEACELSTVLNQIYNLDIYNGSIENIYNGIDLNLYIENNFIVINEHNNTLRVLLIDPRAKLYVRDIVRSKTRMSLNYSCILEERFTEWARANSEKLSSKQLTKLMVSVDTVTIDEYGSDNDDYIADSELDIPSIVSITNKIIIDAASLGASDIHIQPDEKSTVIRMRVDGVLKDHNIIEEKGIYRQIVNRIKVLSELDTNNNKTPQSGKIRLTLQNGTIDTRISTMPTIHGEKVTIRLLSGSNSKISTLSELGIKQDLETKIRRIFNKPNGILLVTGPTGSGKSSTLAAIMQEISSKERCLITIEDPVEYRISNATQVNINNALGLTFSAVLRESLRQDPDIVMVGEIRDTETAKIAMSAANTGHLVFSTLHTNSAATAITRLMDMGVEEYIIADTLIGVLSQQLVRKLCVHCKKEVQITNEMAAEFGLEAKLIGKTVYEPVGCIKCNGIGYLGRTIVPEFIEINQQLVKAIHKKETAKAIQDIAVQGGTKLKPNYAFELALDGITSIKEINRVFGECIIADETPLNN